MTLGFSTHALRATLSQSSSKRQVHALVVMARVLFLLFLSSFPLLSTGFVCSKSPQSNDEVLQVHLVPHTHDDVGWLKNVDQYYYGANNSIQIAGVQYILDSLVPALEANPMRRFIYVEMAFFKRWWLEQSPAMQARVKGLVDRGQLEFINGGWCMNDEATTHYNAIIDQMTLGLQFINENFGSKARPRVAWQIDPFGHSAEQASLFAQMSFEGVFFARIHYADEQKRTEEQSMELMWRGSQSLGEATEIFTGVLYKRYYPPPGLCFALLQCGDPPIQDDPRLFDFNVKERVELFINSSCEQAKHYKSGHIMLTMGGDFHYQNAHVWFKNLDKLIPFVNKDGRVNAFYSTPSKYLDAVKGMKLELKTDDFFPYSDCPHCYWTGYFTSRPALKGYVRRNNNLLQVCKQLEVLGDLGSSGASSERLREAVGVAQHHDAVSGTEQQHVANDYARRLARGAEQCKTVINAALNNVIQRQNFATNIQYTFCDYLNVSACPATETSEPFTITIYNPIARPVDTNIRIPVSSKSVNIYGPDGKPVSTAITPVSDETKFVRGSLGNAPYEMVFAANDLPPLGLVVYTSNTTLKATKHHTFQRKYSPKLQKLNNFKISLEDYVIENKHLRLTFSTDTGRLTKIENLVSKLSIPIDQQFLWYNSSVGNNVSKQASGAYVFRPNSSTPFNVSAGSKVSKISVFKSEISQEVHQVFAPWVSQTIRLYANKPYAEFEYTVGPIKKAPSPELGKEVISRFDTSLKTNGVFYTDANGREMQLRKRDYRPTWTYKDTEPIAGNYYPVNSRAYIKDESGVQLTIITDRSVGGSSIKDGSLEFMVHRRLLHDDKRGVSEPLNEPGINGRGLIVRGKFLLILEPAKSSAKLHRVISEEELLRPSLAFSAGSGHQASYQALARPLPANVHLLTLEKFGKVVLLRLEHQFAVGEDDELSKAVTVHLKGLFRDFTILAVTELNLSANLVKSERKAATAWNRTKRGNASLDNGTLDVTLKPMEIKTFSLDVEWKH